MGRKAVRSALAGLAMAALSALSALSAGCSAAPGPGATVPSPGPQAEPRPGAAWTPPGAVTTSPGPVETSPGNRCHLHPGSTLPPTPPPLPSGGGMRLVHYNAYPYGDDYRAVTALPDGTVYAVGEREFPATGDPCGPRRTLTYAMRWDGRRWHGLPELDRVVEAHRIAASRDGTLWVFGLCNAIKANGGSDSCAARWDGTSWTVSVLNAGGAGAATTGRDEVWAATSDRIRHWDGERWLSQRSPFRVKALQATASGQVWIAGDEGGHVALARRSGRRWTSVPRPPIPRLYGDRQRETVVAALAVGDGGEVWVLGSMYRICGAEEMMCIRPVLMRWSGGRWLVRVVPERLSIGRDIVADGAGGLWVTVPHGVGRLTGGRWRTYEADRGPLGGRSVAALARRPGSASVWAVGRDHTESEEMPFTNGMIWRLD
ncbi:hypothetical protein AB0D67_34575 [Streptosporangium sp. NPDC048047]|uniref:hypothetical protein n=1 Tax=Streptosporangium sp. NPDC048047 TaxID=3155748 RepID=UPI00341D3618